MTSRNQEVVETTLTTEDLEVLTKHFLENLCSGGDAEDPVKGRSQKFTRRISENIRLFNLGKI